MSTAAQAALAYGLGLALFGGALAAVAVKQTALAGLAVVAASAIMGVAMMQAYAAGKGR